MAGLLTPHQIESNIVALDQRLEDETLAYASLCEASARAEAAWKFAYYKALLDVVADEKATKERTNSEYREAKASVRAGAGLFLDYRLADERVRAAQASLTTIRARLDDHRSLNANIRQLAGGRS